MSDAEQNPVTPRNTERRVPVTLHNMGMSNAERQRAWRERRRGDDGHTDERMTVTVSARTRAALRRLARHYDTSQRDIIERLVAEAEERAAGQAGNPYFE